MSRDERLYVEDITEGGAKIRRYTAGMGREVFLADEKTYDAVMRNIQVIGEAAMRLPDDVRSRLTDVQWRRMAGLRDIVTHAYFRIDDTIVWEVVESEIPMLQKTLEEFLAAE